MPTQLAKYGNRLDVGHRAPDRTLRLPGRRSRSCRSRCPASTSRRRAGRSPIFAASLQGSRPNEILYLIDGVRISNRLYNTTPPLDTVPAHMVDHIEVLDGGQGLFFGTSAVAGVINIVTRPFTDTTTGRLSIGGDTNDGVTANGYVSGALGGLKLVANAVL